MSGGDACGLADDHLHWGTNRELVISHCPVSGSESVCFPTKSKLTH
jgi:hypothetical protein